MIKLENTSGVRISLKVILYGIVRIWCDRKTGVDHVFIRRGRDAGE